MYEFVPDEYRRERYEACYAHMIFPVNGRSLWQRTAYTDLQPPPIRRQPGRPKKKRTKDPSEMLRDDSQMKRARYGIKCSRCKAVGHNKSTCKLPPPPAENQATNNPSSNQPQPTNNATTATKKQGASKTNFVATTQTASKTRATATKTAATNVAASNKRGPNTTRQKLPFKRGQTSATQPPSK